MKLTQERFNLLEELSEMVSGQQIGSLEKAFVKVARAYSERNGISYSAWREIGVDPAVLKKANITRWKWAFSVLDGVKSYEHPINVDQRAFEVKSLIKHHLVHSCEPTVSLKCLSEIS